MNRRSFLQPRHAAGPILGPLLEPPPRPADVALLRVGRRAMATQFEILIPFGRPDGQPAAEDALDLIDRLEDQLTVFRETSEVSRLNRLAANTPVPVEAGLFELLALSAHLTAATEGAFDVTAGPLIKTWGFFRRQGRIPTEAERAAALEHVGMRHVALDPARQTVRFTRPGIEINLGSIGKGYALDRAGELLRKEWKVSSALLHGGTSSVLAVGSSPGDPQGWTVALKHPWEPRRLALVKLREQALATSAATWQHFEYNGRKYGHLLDPRGGEPAEGVASATAFAPTAAEADALATAFFVNGPDFARRYCAAHPGAGAVILPDGPDAVPEVIGLDAADVDLAPPPPEEFPAPEPS
jgi:FAD:protein FMN transferase